MEDKLYYTLITGASHGIGASLAEECARRKMNLLLVALPSPDLKAHAQYLSETYGIKAETYEINLTEPDAPKEVYMWCKQNGYHVNILINNAGIGAVDSFEGSNLQSYSNMIGLNVTAVVLLTRLFVPDMKNYPNGKIMNVGSMASFNPVPFKSVYSASKGFVYFFSRALGEELKYLGIKVSVLCPGPVATNPRIIARAEEHGRLSKYTLMSPDEVARKAIPPFLKGQKIIIPGTINKVFLIFDKAIPVRLKLAILAKVFSKKGSQAEPVPAIENTTA